MPSNSLRRTFSPSVVNHGGLALEMQGSYIGDEVEPQDIHHHADGPEHPRREAGEIMEGSPVNVAGVASSLVT